MQIRNRSFIQLPLGLILLLGAQSTHGAEDLFDGGVTIANLDEQTGKRIAQPPAVVQPSQKPLDQMTAAERIVYEAERKFQSGKFFLQEGKPSEARREFDQAIDILLAAPDELEGRDQVERKFEELSRQIHRYDLEALGAGVPQESPVFVQSPLPEILEMTFPVDPRLKDKALAAIQAGTSQLPLTVNDAVASYINYFTSERGKRTLMAGLRRAGRYRPMISRVLAEEGVPQELIHLAQAESGFVPRAVSHKAAVGMWQFIRATGSRYGLAANTIYDDRLDPEKATRAAARHLRDLYQQTGDWYLAMAAYNCGPLCVERAVQRTGYADFWELHRRSALPKETRNYVPAILAMAIVSKNLSAYGIPPIQAEAPLEYDDVELTSPANLGLIADAADVPVADIRELNPHLLRSVAPTGTTVRVPKDRSSVVLAGLASVPVERRSTWRLHRIGEGDTLASIAKRYSTVPKAIVAANSKLDDAFFTSPLAGEMLIIPAAAEKEKVTARARKSTTYRSSRSRTASVRSASRTRVATAGKKSKSAANPSAKRPASRR
jgi:membrane-bound lytic murein transglycosylase D